MNLGQYQGFLGLNKNANGAMQNNFNNVKTFTALLYHILSYFYVKIFFKKTEDDLSLMHDR